MPSSPTTKYDYVPVGTIWPSGDFSVGYKKIEWGDRKTDASGPCFDPDFFDGNAPEYTSTTDAISGFLKDHRARISFYEEMQAAWENPAALDDWLGPLDWFGPAEPLDLTDAPNSHRPSNRPESYGRQGMTGYGKKMVRSACCLLERAYKGRLTFSTVTMPTLPLQERRALAECWPELVRQSLQWLSRYLESAGLPKAVCCVSEIQPNRLQSGCGGYLHLHLVWPNQRVGKGSWAIDVDDFRAFFERFLRKRGLLPEGGWVNVDTKLVKKSAAAYLSKYMSKGGDTLEAFAAENGWDACPKQWWNLTKPMRDAVKGELLKGTAVGMWLESMIDYCLEFCDGAAFWSLRTVDMEFDGRFLTVGYCGILKSEQQQYAVENLTGCR